VTVPPGYVAYSDKGAEGALLASLEAPLRSAIAGGSFYGYAEHHPQARTFTGRGVAYAVPLPEGAADVVIRRSRHGGMLAAFTGDKFFGATRAPKELEISLTLQRRGVPTPEVVAYASYPADALRRRADVVTREVPRSRDLLAALIGADLARKQAAAAATGLLLHRMSLASARHPDLNIKNILLADAPDGAFEAYVLDVDRVWFDAPGSVRATLANWRRFSRSVQKHRAEIGDGFEIIFAVQ
jgi:hypothetical protein